MIAESSRHRRSVAMITVALAASMVLGVPVAIADGPENFPFGEPPFVTVSPSDNLVDGQIVAVSGTEFPPSSVVVLTQCAAEPPFPSLPTNIVCSTLVGPEIRTDASGNFGPVNVPVYEVVVQGDVFGQPRTLYCGPPTSDCDMSAEVEGVVARHRLFFGTDGPGPTTTTVPGGTTTTVAPGGSTTTTTPGGSTTTTTPGGTTTTTTPGGTTTTTVPGGTTTTTTPGGTTTTTVAGGSTTTTVAGGTTTTTVVPSNPPTPGADLGDLIRAFVSDLLASIRSLIDELLGQFGLRRF